MRLHSFPTRRSSDLAAVVSLASAYFFLSRRGVWRWLSLAVFVLTPIAVIAVFALRNLLWVAIVAAAIWLLASMTARLALVRDHPDWRMPERPAEPPARHPYLIMNPKSGGGKVEKFDLKRKAEELGAEVFLIGGSRGGRHGGGADAAADLPHLPRRDRKSTRLNSSHSLTSRMPSSA